MDRNSAIGLTLIGLLLLIYFYWFAPKPEPPTESEKVVTEQVEPTTDSTASESAEVIPQEIDRVLVASYGDLSSARRGEERPIKIENEDLNLEIRNKGGVIM
jgi:YidC/Oxa1 family membrane protein insertase